MTEQQSDAGEPSEVTRVARNLTAIVELAALLPEQATYSATDSDNPERIMGGSALVALGPVASTPEWAERIAAAEFRHYATCQKSSHKDCTIAGAEHVADQDDQDDPLWTLWFWTEAWREEWSRPAERPTFTTEAGFLREVLNWVWQNEAAWDDFARDVQKVRRSLESMLRAGVRKERGVPCMYPECRGTRLERSIDDAGQRDDWRCPRCDRRWSEDRYAQMITAAHEASKFEDIDGETWCSIDYAARKVDRSVKTIRTWLNRGELETVCIIAGRRVRFARLDQVRDRHDAAKRRRSRAA